MFRYAAVWAMTLAVASATVRADAIHNLATALDYAGFDARGSHNPLSGGAELLVTRTFNGNFFDFGAADLMLQGPISLQVTAGGRLLPTLDATFSTAFNAQNPPTELNYNFSSDTGPQSTTISGSTVIDSKFSINALGFYDVSIATSTRGTINREGYVTESSTLDSDIGPIIVSGNVFADALAILTEPLFEQSGSENPFSTVSKMLIDSNSVGILELASLSEQDAQALLNPDSFDALHPASSRLAVVDAPSHVIVPEPTVLVLLLLGLPLVVRQAWRAR